MERVLVVLGDLDAQWQGASDGARCSDLVIRFDPASNAARVVKDRHGEPRPVRVETASGKVIHAG